MLLGQWSRSLVGLERSLLNEIEALPDKSVRVVEDADQRRACRETKGQARETGAPNSPTEALPQEEAAYFKGFLF